jgi:hypothetical protein
METVFTVGSAPRLYNEDLNQLRRELNESFEMAVGDEWEEMARKELGCEKKAWHLLQLQWDWCNYCVEIRCQDTTSEDRGP